MGWWSPFSILFNHRSFFKSRLFPLGFEWLPEKKDPWKEWEGTPRRIVGWLGDTQDGLNIDPGWWGNKRETNHVRFRPSSFSGEATHMVFCQLVSL